MRSCRASLLSSASAPFASGTSSCRRSQSASDIEAWALTEPWPCFSIPIDRLRKICSVGRASGCDANACWILRRTDCDGTSADRIRDPVTPVTTRPAHRRGHSFLAMVCAPLTSLPHSDGFSSHADQGRSSGRREIAPRRLMKLCWSLIPAVLEPPPSGIPDRHYADIMRASLCATASDARSKGLISAPRTWPLQTQVIRLSPTSSAAFGRCSV